ncbi:hypothetical protein ACWGB8_02720 [Kitasatospora sp. NPDC054939]
MALFRRRSAGGGTDTRTARRPFGRSRKDDVLTVDPTHGDPLGRLVLAQVEELDWPALRDTLTGVTDQADLVWLVDLISDTEGMEKWTPKAIAAEPGSALPLLLSGARHIDWAWEARTGAYAKYVTEEQWKLFRERLLIAEDHLYRAAELDPRMLAPWHLLQTTALGLSLGPDVARHRFEAAVRRCPGHVGTHRARLQQLAAKWGGSHEEMHAFARASMLAAPEGSPLGELVALAHIEHWLSLDSGEDGDYIRSKAVVASLHEAARRSVGHPAHVRTRGWASAYNSFAMAFSLAGELATAHALFGAIGDRVTASPWRYLAGDPVDAFRSHRKRCTG